MKSSTTLVSAIFSAALMANVYASGEFDIATAKCADPSTPEEDEALIVWLDGYLTAIAGRTESSENDMEQLGKFLGAECMKDPNQTILSVIEKL